MTQGSRANHRSKTCYASFQGLTKPRWIVRWTKRQMRRPDASRRGTRRNGRPGDRGRYGQAQCPLGPDCNVDERDAVSTGQDMKRCRKRGPNSFSVIGGRHLARKGAVQTTLDTCPDARNRPGLHQVGPEASRQGGPRAPSTPSLQDAEEGAGTRLPLLRPKKADPDAHRAAANRRLSRSTIETRPNVREGNLFQRDHRERDARGPGAEPGFPALNP